MGHIDAVASKSARPQGIAVRIEPQNPSIPASVAERGGGPRHDISAFGYGIDRVRDIARRAPLGHRPKLIAQRIEAAAARASLFAEAKRARLPNREVSAIPVLS